MMIAPKRAWFTPESFINAEIFWRAMTHRSANKAKNNEQLELLGDAVLHLITVDWLTKSGPETPEGTLCQRVASYTCGANLVRLARKYDLGNYLILGKGEEHSGGRDKPKILEDAFEALIGGIYRDGGMESARRFVTYIVLEDNPDE